MSENLKFNLRALRSNRNLTQKDAAKLVGVSVDVWGNWEREDSYPDVPKIQAIENAFGVSYNDIIFFNKNTVLNGKK